MRLSVLKNDPGYNLSAAMNCRVLIDDIDVSCRCYTADEEEGKVYLHKLNDEGKVYPNDLGNIASEVLEGKVVIELNAR